ncbi:hypothetical protein PF007_g17584 [Phytophthora fragariae]|uniref:Uncharacterized protein n=1 Tax=Phytophthora fragariae TaxID=53985 RepID=A0A6A3REB9_9STRA|nr:hypothetical protein PF007_g17584 [Phytophthora fragariae]
MHVVACKPSVPARNPPRASYVGHGGRTVRLEAPDELRGPWAGPAYATLIGEPQLRSDDQGPFFDGADDAKRPAWQVVLTLLLPGERMEDIDPALRDHVDVPYWVSYWRLTQTSRNLTSELQERPLLSVFRFLRFTQFFVASPRCDTKFTKHTSDVCSYIQGYSGERHQVVAIPFVDARSQAISRDEFVMGFFHGIPTTLQPTRFDTAWRSFSTSPPASRASVRQHLAQAFTAPGAEATVDLGTQAVEYVTPRGTKTSIVPAAYAWRSLHPTSSIMVLEEGDASPDAYIMHETDDVELPLLTRAEADLTPGDQFSTPLPSQPRQAPGALRVEDVQAVASQGPGPETRDSATGRPMADLSGEALMRALLLEQRATNTALQSQLSVLSASVESIQARLAAP